VTAANSTAAFARSRATVRAPKSLVARGLGDELDAGADIKLRVDVTEMCLHGSWGNEKPGRDLLIAETFANQTDDVVFGRGERFPADAGPLAVAAAALCLGDRLLRR
jgi:hypothetical protein